MGLRFVPTAPEAPSSPRVGIKICLVGDPAVGKTCLAVRYIFRRHEKRYLRTYRARIFRKRLRADFGDGGPGMTVDLELWDAPGNPTLFSVVHDVFFHRADGILVACDATRRQTMQNLPFWVQAVRRAIAKPDTRILVNKTDRLRGKQPLQDMPRMARHFNAPWAMVSAATGQNVEGAFTGLVGEILLRRWPAAYREESWARAPFDARGRTPGAYSPAGQAPLIPR